MLLPLPAREPWTTEYFGNSVNHYLTAVAVFVGLLIAFRIVQWLVIKRLEVLANRTTTDIDDTAVKVVQEVKPPVYTTVALYVAVRTLSLNETAIDVFTGILITVLVYQVIVSLQILFDFIIERRIAKGSDPGDRKTDEAALTILHQVVSVILWAIGLLFVLSNFGVNVTSLIAGLGIGGLAFALAAQSILSDLFASLAIYLDKPFRIGDTIKVGSEVGTVKHIGIKTTRLQSIDGEEVVLTNQELTNSKVNNFRSMEKRRVSVDLGVTYETPAEKVKKVPELIEESLADTEGITFGRAHFKSFGDSALIFELVYYVNDRDYGVYMDVQQDVNFSLKAAFDKEGIEFAYPTQTLYVNK